MKNECNIIRDILRYILRGWQVRILLLSLKNIWKSVLNVAKS